MFVNKSPTNCITLGWVIHIVVWLLNRTTVFLHVY
jgi:hypothetical protein